MATTTVIDLLPAFSGLRSSSSSSSSGSVASSSSFSVIGWSDNQHWHWNGFCHHRCRTGRKSRFEGFKAMVQQTTQGASANYAKEMEILSAKESLLLAVLALHFECMEIDSPFQFKDSGGFASQVTGKTSETQRIDVNERITALEKLNPTPRPTTIVCDSSRSPFLDGRWNFEWLGAGTPGLFAARFLFARFPSTLATLLGMDVVIKDGYSKTTANVLLLNSIESKFFLTTKLTLEGPLRMKEEYVEGVLDMPTVNEAAVPEQLKGVFGQALGSLQQLPVPIKDLMANGLKLPLSVFGQALGTLQQLPVPTKDVMANEVKLPLSGTFQRLFMISYLDEEILIIRDTAGVPDVLTRLDAPFDPALSQPIITEYES